MALNAFVDSFLEQSEKVWDYKGLIRSKSEKNFKYNEFYIRYTHFQVMTFQRWNENENAILIKSYSSWNIQHSAFPEQKFITPNLP